MDFPSRPPIAASLHRATHPRPGRQPEEVLAAQRLLLVYKTEEQVRALKPDMTGMIE